MKPTICISIFFILINTSSLLACSCNEKRTVIEEITHSDAVFVGIPLSKKMLTFKDPFYADDTASYTESWSTFSLMQYDFLVQDIYKGIITKDTISIFTGISGADCGIAFEIGNQYIIYGETESYSFRRSDDFPFKKAENTYWTYNCLRTTTFNQDEIQEIERYKTKIVQKKRFTDDEIFITPEILPVYKDGGNIGLQKFIANNLRYPKEMCIEGLVVVEFTVDTLGHVKDIKILRGIAKEADNEAIKVVKMLTFIPGSIYGKVAEIKLALPIRFKM